MIKRVLPAILALFLIAGILSASSASASQTSARTLRIGFPIQPGLTEIDEDGNYAGYTYEYLEEIAQYTGWDYEFVQLPGTLNESLSAMLEMLENGELDLMGGFIYNDALAEKYEYAGQSYGSAHTVFNVLSEDTHITKNNYLSLDSIRVAVIQGANTRIEEMKQFCAMNNLDYELVPCESSEEQMTALQENRADVILEVDLNIVPEQRTIAKFAPRPYYFATTVGNDDIVQQINSALLSIEEADPCFSTRLYETYFNPQEKSLVLSDSDREFIRQSGPLKVGVLLDNPPFQSQNTETGELTGISLKLLDNISKTTGLKFELVPVTSQEQLEEKILANEIDLVSSTAYDYLLARKQGIALTRPYASSQYIMVVNKDANLDSIKNQRFALPKQIEYEEFAFEQILWYDNLQDCLDAVHSGQADYTYGNGYSIQYYLNNPKYRYLRSIPQSSNPYQVSLGVVQTENTDLLSILNKVIGSLSEEDLQSIIYQNTIQPQEYTLSNLVESNPEAFILIIGGLALFIIGVLLWILHIRNRINRKNTMNLKKHYQLYELSNEHFFEYNYATGLFEAFFDQEMSPEELLNVTAYTYEDDLEEGKACDSKPRKPFLEIIASKGDGIRDIHCAVPDGSPQWLRITYRTIRDDGGKPAYLIGKITNIDQEKQEKAMLLDQARKDSLTQLFNAAACRSLISQRLSKLESDGHGALIILDVDYFKNINDLYGHFVGDKMLVETATAINSTFRKQDIVGRLGGDEFIIYMDGETGEETVRERCSMLCEKIGSINLPNASSRISVSIGVAIARCNQSFNTLYQQADRALYQVKNRGRNGFEILGL